MKSQPYLIGVAMIVIIWTHSAILRGETTLSGEEILARMKKAQENFYSYERTRKYETVISKSHYFAQDRPEGEGNLLWSETTRINDPEDDKPTKDIAIYVGYEKLYWYYPDDNIAAELSYQLQRMRQNAERTKQRMSGAVITFAPVKEVVYDNADCYELNVTSTKEGETLAEEHYMIDRKTFLPRLHNGTELGKSFRYEYQNVRPEPEMTLDFFELPEGVVVKKATNDEEFKQVMDEIDLVRFPPLKIETVEETMARLEANLSPQDKAMLESLRKKETVEEVTDRLDRERAARKQAELDEFTKRAEAVRKKDDRRRTIFLVAGNAILLAALIYCLTRKYRKRRC